MDLKNNLRNIIAAIFSVFFLLAVGLFVYFKVLPEITLFSSSALAVASGNTVAQVYLNGRLLGTTPLHKEAISQKKATLRVTSPQNAWESSLNFTPNTETTVNLDLGVSSMYSGSDVVWLERRSGAASLSVISDPDGVLVTVDEVDLGSTPMSVNLKAGPHMIKFSKDNYASRSLNIMARDNYKLNISTHLFLLPLKRLTEIPSTNSKVQILAIGSDSPLNSSDFKSWAEAVVYWQTQTEASPSATFNYLLDSSGGLYDRGGSLLTGFPTSLPAKVTVGYLGKPGEKALSPEASATLTKLLNGGVGAQIKVLPTGQAWLRVRSEPNGAEIGKATVGNTYPKVAEQDGWTQIIFDGVNKGWVSSNYVADVKPQGAGTP